jgi:hypothetical protein
MSIVAILGVSASVKWSAEKERIANAAGNDGVEPREGCCNLTG